MRSLSFALGLCVFATAGVAQKNNPSSYPSMQTLAVSDYTEGLPTAGLSPLFFSPGTSARTSEGPIHIASSIMAARLQHRVDPSLPSNTLADANEGPVLLEVHISKEGRVREVHALRGAPRLIAAAQSAVRQWTYQPYLLEGRPSEVITKVAVRFEPGR